MAQSTPRKSTSFIIVVALISVIAASFAFFYVGKFSFLNEHKQESRYQTIQKRGSIRACYYVGAPYFTIDPKDNTKGGIFFDVVESVGKKLSLKIDWVSEVGFGEMPEALSSGKCDIIGSGIWISASRGNRSDFTIPILYDSVGAYVRSEDHRFDNNLAALDQAPIKISSIDGEMAATIAATDYPKATLTSLPQNSDFTQMILNVVNQKADVTFLARGPALKFMAANPNQIRQVESTRPIRVFPTAVMLPQDEYALKATLDIALTEMLNNGEIDSIIRKYEEIPGTHFRAAPGYEHKQR